jgi:hypothetical protein
MSFPILRVGQGTGRRGWGGERRNCGRCRERLPTAESNVLSTLAIILTPIALMQSIVKRQEGRCVERPEAWAHFWPSESTAQNGGEVATRRRTFVDRMKIAIAWRGTRLGLSSGTHRARLPLAEFEQLAAAGNHNTSPSAAAVALGTCTGCERCEPMTSSCTAQLRLHRCCLTVSISGTERHGTSVRRHVGILLLVVVW